MRTGQPKVRVLASVDDALGRQLVYKFKEGLRSSKGMQLAEPEDVSAIEVRIATQDPDIGEDSPSGQSRTIYSVIWTGSQPGNEAVQSFLDHYLGVCGGQRLDDISTLLLAETDRVLEGYKKAIRSVPKEPGP